MPHHLKGRQTRQDAILLVRIQNAPRQKAWRQRMRNGQPVNGLVNAAPCVFHEVTEGNSLTLPPEFPETHVQILKRPAAKSVDTCKPNVGATCPWPGLVCQLDLPASRTHLLVCWLVGGRSFRILLLHIVIACVNVFVSVIAALHAL